MIEKSLHFYWPAKMIAGTGRNLLNLRGAGALVIFMIAVLLSATVMGQTTGKEYGRPAIGGYSPVSYFTEKKAERGSSDFSVEHNGQIYYLTSQQQVQIFERNPDKYRPRHKSCPYSLAFGMVLPLDPTSFKIIGGTLLLFHLSEEKDSLAEWNNSELTEEELLRRADANIFLITF